MLETYLLQRIQNYQAQGLYRTRKLITRESPNLSFSSCDYLGLSRHPKVINALKKGIEQYGFGNGSSAVVTGYTKEHEELEILAAKFLGYKKALIFNSGYMANMGIIPALTNKKTNIYIDKLSHASIIDGCLLSNAKLRRYPHLNVKLLENHLQESSSALVMTDGVFSMSGAVAPLPQLANITQKANATLIVDDAHGLGVLGKNGRGCIEHFNLTAMQIPILVCSMGKAIGGMGAIVASNETIIESLVQFARTYMYTINMPSAMASAAKVSLQLIAEESWRREKLQTLINYFRSFAAEQGMNILPSVTPIQSIIISDIRKLLQIQQQLHDQGIYVSAIRPPTVPKNTARLRISLTANHEKADIDKLLEALALLCK